jgi:hypothetical protein
MTPGARRDLLRVLTSTPNVRADVIRQFHERGADDMVELLMLARLKLGDRGATHEVDLGFARCADRMPRSLLA